MKFDEVGYEDFQQHPIKKLKHYHVLENPKEEFMNEEIIKYHKNQEKEISPIEKQLMKSIMEYYLDPEISWRIDKDKEMNLDKGNSIKYFDVMSYWKLPEPEEEPDYLILPYIEFK
ncbi:hypothetical protein O181_014000 [Austropuccinia psidii MF-1]|uniref:Uncharacterized protein n=1 Tax=Austropuccinia psidii MF-1 TaxID=1389203 RepID=A0A9Q3C122_9BASI|nr:hypothetical protein [Austropuccinia psidii MF-1]